MPGHTNKKQSQRTKGNVRPSSSSQAAQLLVTAGTAPTGFVGFGGFSGSPGYVPASQVFDDVDSTLDADFRMVLRKLTKKDSTTKVKALQEFSSLCEEKDIEHLKAVLPFWPRIYNKVSLDVDHKVRECTQQAMNTLVLRVRKNLAPYLRSLMGSWLLCQCDTYPTVASAAQQAFQTAFPPAKQTDALVYCKSVVTEYLVDNLINQTANTLSDSQTTEPDDMTNKYNRVLTSSLLALRKLITSIPANQIEDLKEHFKNMLKDGKFWKHGKTTIISIKAAMYTFLAGLCQTMPDVAEEFSKKLSPFILNNIDERDPVICPAVWEAVLSLANYVKGCWTDVSVEKSLWPKLRNMLENGCYGNCSLIAADLLPFISKVPPDILKEENKFYLEFLNHMKLGLGKEQVQSSSSECSALVRAFIECTQFVTKEIAGRDMTSLQIILQDQLLPVVVSSIVESTSALYKTPLYSVLGVMMEKLEKSGNDDVTSMVLSYWTELSDRIKERLSVDEECTKVADRVILLVKSLIYPQIVSKVKSDKVRFQTMKTSDDTTQSLPDKVRLTEGMRMFVQYLTIQAFQNAHKQWNPASLHLFSALIELEPAGDTIKLVIERCHGDVDTDQCHSNYFVFNVCLPWLQHAQAEGMSMDQKQLISVICTFMALLDNSSLSVLLKTLTETVENFEAFHHLLTKCIQLESTFTSIKQWLHSDILGQKLVTIATVICSESIKSAHGTNIQYGWDIISLVLTADKNSDQIIGEGHIKEILQVIHGTLLSLGDNSDQNKADVAVSFVSKATQSFFLSSKNCLLLPSAEDLLVTLFTISLDNTYKISDETLLESETVWMTGMGSIVRLTGCLLKDDGLLQKAVSVIKDNIMKVEHLDMFERLINTVDKLLTVVRENLPTDSGDNLILTDLKQMLYVKCETSVPKKVLQYLMLKGQLTFLSMKQRSGHEYSFTQTLFPALFNLRLLTMSEAKPDEPETRPVELDAEEIKLFLLVLYSMNIVNEWKEMDNKICKYQTQTTEQLESIVSSQVLQLSDSTKKYVMSAALESASEKGSVWSLALQSLLSLYTNNTDFTLNFNTLLDRCSELDENRVQVLQVAAPFLLSDNRHTLAEIMVARMMSAEPLVPVNGGIQALAVLNAVVKENDDLESCKELIEGGLSQILTWKEEKDDLLLYSSDITHARPDIVFANLEIMKFIQLAIRIIPGHMTDKDWDFIMCSIVSFAQSVEESADRLKDSLEVQIFTCNTCRLLAALATCIQTDTTEKSFFPPNLITEWNEFFSEGIFSVLLPLFLKLSVQYSRSTPGQMYQVLQSVSLSVCQCPKQQVMDHKLPPYLKTDDTSSLPDSLQTLLNHVCPLLSHDVREVQLAAFHMLYSIIPELPQYEKENKESEEEEVSRCPPQQLMNVLLVGMKLEDLLSGLGVEDYLKVYPQTEKYTLILSYLLTWRLLLHLFKASTAEIRQEYAIYFRQTGIVHQLLSNIYRLMPDNPTQDTKIMFDKNFSLKVQDTASHKDIQYLSCSVYRQTLQTVPALVRQWWREQDRKTINYVDRFTSKHVSQILCTEEIQPVNKTDIQLDNITIKTRPITREVIATYALDEVTIEMVIALPENYPLGTITVVSEKRVGVTAATWDKWLLQLNVFLQYQNGSIVDGLRIWKRNIDKRFEGVEDCMICFSVIHGTNYQLPRLTCKTCKKKFHSACLYKWFQTSHNSTCPLCRNLF